MSSKYDTVIVGAGLAGICSALHLCSRERVLVVDSNGGRGGASAIAAGLANTFMARKARAAWRHREAIDALVHTADLAGATDLFDRSGVFRPAVDAKQEVFFRQSADLHEECHYLPRKEANERWQRVQSPLGGLLIEGCGAVDVPAFLDRAVDVLRGLDVDVRFHCRIVSVADAGSLARITTADGEKITARRALVAAGDGTSKIAGIPPLYLHRIKGQTIDVTRATDALATDVPHLAGIGYVVSGADGFTVGSSYQHAFEDLLPDHEVTRQILDKACLMLPGLSEETVVGESAGVRMTVPGTRLPMVGPVSGKSRVWVFSGLGSKGLLMAPLVTRDLFDFFLDPAAIPTELRVQERPR